LSEPLQDLYHLGLAPGPPWLQPSLICSMLSIFWPAL
jgi:hypothetical protein